MLCTIYVVYRYRRDKKELLELRAAGLANFDEGNLNCFDPTLALDQQGDLLPYDRSREFPKDKLELITPLGKGAFGEVWKGIARGILQHEEETVVAVKMVNKVTFDINNEMMRSLISELKIMVHLGKHLNVVNLLGAVTPNILQRNV